MNPLRQLGWGAVAALVCLASPAYAGLLTDSDPNWKEGDYALPPAPAESTLLPFFVSSASPNRYLIDRASLAIGGDGVVRYVLVVRTPGGASNVTFEGIHCATAEWRLYAVGHSGGKWARARSDAWRPVVDNSYDRARAALAEEYLCDSMVPPRTKEEALSRLEGKAKRLLEATD